MYNGGMYPRIFVPPEQQSYFLFGPRGTGKSVFTGNFYKQGLFFDLLDSRIYNEFMADPGRLSRRIPEGFSDWVIIDEVQKVPALLNEVHRLVENRRIRFVLTGSSARRLRRDNVNLLAGRALTCRLHPLTAAELGTDFDLARALRYGQLPMACTSADPEMFLQSYVRIYLQEEIQQEGLTRNLPAFSRFLESASFSQGSPLNVSAIARDCAVNRKVVENYFSILRDTLVSYEIPVFTKRAKRATVQSAKFYFSTRAFSARCGPQVPTTPTRRRKAPRWKLSSCRKLPPGMITGAGITASITGAPGRARKLTLCFMARAASRRSR